MDYQFVVGLLWIVYDVRPIFLQWCYSWKLRTCCKF